MGSFWRRRAWGLGAKGLGASRVHDDRWGRNAQTKEVDLRRALGAEWRGGGEKGGLGGLIVIGSVGVKAGKKGRRGGASGVRRDLPVARGGA